MHKGTYEFINSSVPAMTDPTGADNPWKKCYLHKILLCNIVAIWNSILS